MGEVICCHSWEYKDPEGTLLRPDYCAMINLLQIMPKQFGPGFALDCINLVATSYSSVRRCSLQFVLGPCTSTCDNKSCQRKSASNKVIQWQIHVRGNDESPAYDKR